MATILLIDSNPDNRKSIEGLLRYRTQHRCESVDSPTEGARKAVSVCPDLIMMNVLMFMGKNYAFPRVMQQHEKTMHISFLVHATGPLDAVTEKQIQASGMASFVYLPASAEELEGAIQTALAHTKPANKGDVAPVVWQQASRTEAAKTIRPSKQKTKKASVQPVHWPQAEKNVQQTTPTRAQKQTQAKRKTAPSPQKTSGFQRAAYTQVDEEGKHNKATFKRERWETVDPKDVK